MHLIVVDANVEGQTALARRVRDLGDDEIDKLELNIGLSNIQALDKKLPDADVVILSSGTAAEAFALTRKIKTIKSQIEVIAFVSDTEYSAGAFLKLRDSGVRIVLPQRATPLDLLQVLVAIDSEQRLNSTKAPGQLTVFVNGKGGLGTTTFAAALGDFLGHKQRSVLLWDLDIETRDLSRALLQTDTRSQRLTDFVTGEVVSTKAALKAACVKWQRDVCVLPPPDVLAAGLDLVSHPDSITLIERIIDSARELFNHTIVDLGGRLGPGAAKLMQLADNLIILVDDSWLGVTATAAYLNAISPVFHGNFSTLNFIGAGTKLSMQELRSVVEKQAAIRTEERAWQSGAVPFDAAARRWPGSGATLYSIGTRLTKQVIAQLGERLDAPLERLVVTKPVRQSVELVTSELLPDDQLDVSHPFAPKPELAKSIVAELEPSQLGDF